MSILFLSTAFSTGPTQGWNFTYTYIHSQKLALQMYIPENSLNINAWQQKNISIFMKKIPTYNKVEII